MFICRKMYRVWRCKYIGKSCQEKKFSNNSRWYLLNFPHTTDVSIFHAQCSIFIHFTKEFGKIQKCIYFLCPMYCTMIIHFTNKVQEKCKNVPIFQCPVFNLYISHFDLDQSFSVSWLLFVGRSGTFLVGSNLHLSLSLSLSLSRSLSLSLNTIETWLIPFSSYSY